MELSLGFLVLSIVKIAGILAYIYFLLRVLGNASKWVKIAGIVGAFALVQFALSFQAGEFRILNDFDRGLLFQAATMTMCALGLNLIYGYQRPVQPGAVGLLRHRRVRGCRRYVSLEGGRRARTVGGRRSSSCCSALIIWGIGRLLKRYKGMPVLSQFTLYLIGTFVAGAHRRARGKCHSIRCWPRCSAPPRRPGPCGSDVAMQVIFPIAVLLGGVVAAETAFLFGLPVLTLGSDYFGIATLGFSIVVYTLMMNSDTILPIPEMRGGQGMLDIPQMGVTAWFWGFVFLVLVIVVMRNLVYSSTGRAMISVREDETAAKVDGHRRGTARSCWRSSSAAYLPASAARSTCSPPAPAF